jgi:hypothetical protein
MGMFDEEARKMASEAEQQVRSDAERAKELHLIAQSVSRDLVTYLGQHQRGENIDVGVLHNVVRATGRTSHRMLEITCEGPDDFHLRDSNVGFQTQVMAQPPRPIGTRGAAITRSDMARRVLAWLQERRAVA